MVSSDTCISLVVLVRVVPVVVVGEPAMTGEEQLSICVTNTFSSEYPHVGGGGGGGGRGSGGGSGGGSRK